MCLSTLYFIQLKLVQLPEEVFPQSQRDDCTTLRAALTAGQQVVVTQR